MEQVRRVGAYGVLRDAERRALLVRGSAEADFPVVWSLPGGGLEHAEHPVDAVVREVAEETGLAVEVTGLRAVVADVTPYPDLGVALHTDRVLFDVTPLGGLLRAEPAGTTNLAGWFTSAEASALPLLPFTAEALGLPVVPLPPEALRRTAPFPPSDARRRQRFGAYGVVTDPAGRVLLSLIADGYPGAGRWHLPGGGTDHGEQPVTALLRELVEESGQLGRVTELIVVDNLHNPAALGPEGYPLDWHGVRVVYRVLVDLPTVPKVTELAGGSTADSAWFTISELQELPLTEIASEALAALA
ncbi:NUDIX hydrolase [Micromonospora craniellae]|uniref:NUDIX domain-containing protein n=1 Tax=Micromonospora craniellae TaxID=2294034 RepID=A0A372G629_9ACTN|nr:NUDIX domain-containing protein [Micromonospora craniellae]QOC90382.1 NUDIX domain-containing protein [Micromonospora craniellae]RFS48229.1 NUDIX domain-containing protein [Micromonospora craniellae]